MENASIKLDTKTMYFSNGVPYEDLKRALKDQGIKNTLRECREEVKTLFPQTIQTGSDKSPGVTFFSLVYELIKLAKEDPECLQSNADSLRIMLPLIIENFPYSNPLAESFDRNKDNVHKVKKLLKNVLKQQETMTVLNAYRKVVIKNVKRMDSRGSNSYPDGPYNSAEAWREAVRNEIASLYNVFYLYNFINKAPHKKVSVSQRLLNTLGMVYHRFPIQSTLFALSFYEKQIENVANKRDELLSWKPASIFSMRINDNSNLFDFAIQFIEECEGVLAKAYRSEYVPIKYPGKESMRMKSPYIDRFFFRWANTTYETEISDKDDEVEQEEKTEDAFKKYIPFALPICKSRALAKDIATHCSLDEEKTKRLMKELPSILYHSSFERKSVCDNYGEDVSKILDIFHSLSSLEYYNMGDEFATETERHKSFIKKYIKDIKYLEKTGFLTIESIEENFRESRLIKRCMLKYFDYKNVSKYFFMISSSLLPTEYPGSLTKFFSKLREKMESELDDILHSTDKNRLYGFEFVGGGMSIYYSELDGIINNTLTVKHILSFISTCILSDVRSIEGLIRSLEELLKQEEWKAVSAHSTRRKLSNDKVYREHMLTVFEMIYGNITAVVSELYVGIIWKLFVFSYFQDDEDGEET